MDSEKIGRLPELLGDKLQKNSNEDVKDKTSTSQKNFSNVKAPNKMENTEEIQVFETRELPVTNESAQKKKVKIFYCSLIKQ